jgi:8-oxo-dGTP pyrophosphatase MutT (NUDIX family)
VNERPIRKSKAHGYLTRYRAGTVELLVFSHARFPEAGLQVPGGSLDAGESPVDALHRELLEEAGLSNLTVLRPLAPRILPFPTHGEPVCYHAFHLSSSAQLPDQWVYQVSAGEDDRGLLFEYFWLPLPVAAQSLIANLRGPAEELCQT